MNRLLQSASARRLLFIATPTTTTTPPAKRFALPSPFPPSRTLKPSRRMSSTRPDFSPSDSLTLSTQPHHPVQVVAAPGVTESHFRSAVESSLFRNWVKNLEGEGGILANGAACLKQVLIQGVDMFGNRIGFLKFKADIFDSETGKKVEEETGIKLNLEDMVDLTSFLDPSTGCRIFPSPGGCDEEISVFLYRGHVEKGIIEQLQGREGGLVDDGELIKVRVVPYEELWRRTPDAKVLMAVALYEKAERNGLLPPLKA